MTEKRYDVIDKLEPRGQSVTDGGIPCTARTCVTRLNRLTEENEQLKQRIKELEIGENEIILKQETTINQLIKEKEELKDGLQEFREYCNYLKSILEDNEIWYE